MRVFGRIGALVVIPLTIMGCVGQTSVPSVTKFPRGEQIKLEAAQNWQVIACHLASQIAERLQSSAPGRSVSIDPPARATAFESALASFLTSELVKRGVPVTSDAGRASMDLKYNVQTVHHRDRYIAPPPGTFTVLAAGVLALSNVGKWSHPELLVLPAGLGVDIYNATQYGYPPNTEVIVHLTVTDGTQYIASESAIYYVHEPDIEHYTQRPEVILTRHFEVVDQ